MIGLWNVNWLNQNSQRAYPFVDFATKVSNESPEVVIPDDFLLALRLSVHTGHDVRVENFFLKSIVVSGAGCTVTFGYNDGGSYPDVAVAAVSAGDGVVDCRMSGIGSFSDTVGYCAFDGNSPVFTDWIGFYTFLPSSTPIEPDCIVPMLRSVTSLRVNDGNMLSDKYFGDITLVAGANVSISTAPTSTGATITINAISTDGFVDDCTCDIHEEDQCVTSIGGVTPDSEGNVNLAGNGCVAVSGGGNTLTIRDTCATPDCGCDELEVLAATVREMEDGITTLNTFIENLYAIFVQTNQAITASSPGSGCGTSNMSLKKIPK